MEQQPSTETKDIKKIKFVPLGDRLLIEPDEARNVTEGGIFIPDNARERPQIGTVIACGEGKDIDSEILKKLNAIMIKLDISFKYSASHKFEPGMRVLYGRNAGSEIDYDGKKVLIMRMSDVAGIIE